MAKTKKKTSKKKPVQAKKKTTKAAAKQPAPVETSPMPTAGNKVTEFERVLDEAIAKDPRPQHGGARGGSGRKPKPQEPPPAEVPMLPPSAITNAVTELLKAPFDLWAIRADLPELALTQPEAETLTAPALILLDYYVPNMRPIDWAWISLAITGIAIMRPRMVLLQGMAKQGGQRETSTSPRPAASVSLVPDVLPNNYKPQKL